MTNLSTTPDAIGKRLRFLRDEVAHLTIAEFANLAGVSNPSISYWENGQIDNPIKPKSMAKVIEGFKKVGIEVNERWLKIGEGEPPRYKGEPIKLNEREFPVNIAFRNNLQTALIETDTKLAALLGDELRAFATLENAVITKVDHYKMAPYLKPGDHVGGIWQSTAALTEEAPCILKLNNQLHVGCIRKGSKEGLFDIFYANDKQSSQIKNIALEKLAPIVRVWR